MSIPFSQGHLFWRRLVIASLACLLTGWLPSSATAQNNNPQIKDSVGKAAAYLRQALSQRTLTQGFAPTGQRSLTAYALIKAGDSPTDALIQPIVDDVVRRTSTGTYNIDNDGHYAIYTAGTELMLLEAADPEKYRPQMEIIVNYIRSHQDSSGAWDYIDGFRGGDTSQVQYALLGCWAAQRAGIEVPLHVWDNCARWLIQTQTQNGGFAYHPRGDIEVQKEVTHSMTIAAVACLLICKQHLYPNDTPIPRESDEPPKFGVLEKVDLDASEQTAPKSNQDYRPTTSLQDIQSAVDRGLAWYNRGYRIPDMGIWGLYSLYSLERMAALADVPTFAGHDWYREGSEYLIKTQAASGSWKDNSTEVPATAFGILFLARSTAKILGRPIEDPLGSGLLAGGRGLPSDLSKAALESGKPEEKKDLGPIDQLLAELEKVESVDLEKTQESIVEKVLELGDREELIKQKPRLLKLAKHPDPEIRRTALWAIARTEDLSLAKHLFAAFDDPDVDVMVEAQNGFCILSRNPLGFGLPQTPFEGLPENATEQERQQAVESWRAKLKEKWGQWYYKFRPYEERDDLSESLFLTPRK